MSADPPGVIFLKFFCEKKLKTNKLGPNVHISAWSLLEGQYGLSTYSLQPSHLSFTSTILATYTDGKNPQAVH